MLRDRQTDRQTDIAASRVAFTRLKNEKEIPIDACGGN